MVKLKFRKFNYFYNMSIVKKTFMEYPLRDITSSDTFNYFLGLFYGPWDWGLLGNYIFLH
ncbi:MAG: hypothetical protein CM15mP83_5240 [Flavobacteriaceae bacterium]|nr:MAG: hypothetical protein CM15mP83_5240 [Flavobacteriaceae bacterium]